MPIATLPADIDAAQLDELFDLDVRIEVTDADAPAGFTSFGCSLTCSSCVPSTCYC